MDPRSERSLAFVHPDLVAIIRETEQLPQAFIVVEGIRTVAQEQHNVDTGHSTTMHSRHLPNAEGLSCAVDVAAIIGGKVSFTPGQEAEVFGAIAAQVKAAAEELGIPVEWGGDWRNFKDWGHFQLPWKEYP